MLAPYHPLLCSDSDGPAAFPNFDFQTFFTISMGIGIGGPSSGVHQIDVQDPTKILH